MVIIHRMKRYQPWCVRAAAAISLAALGCASFPQAIEIQALGRKVQSEDGHSLAAYELRLRGEPASRRQPRALLFYVQGSENESCLKSIEHLAGASAMGARVVLMERRGIGFEGAIDRDAAVAASTKPIRVADHRAVIDAFLRDAPAGVPVILVGASEGGDVASAIAAREPRISHLVLVGCGGGWSQAEELARELERTGAVLGITSRRELEDRFGAIRSRPDSLESWAGHPYRRWSSFLWSPPMDDLLQVQAPILAVHGSEDRNVPVGSARALRDAFWARGRGNLTYLEYAGLDHRLVDPKSGRSGFPRFEVDLLGWLEATGAVTRAEASTMAARVRRAHPEAFGSDSRRSK
jgi:pimeloyl-ACP methyl ester carboxylesterase